MSIVESNILRIDRSIIICAKCDVKWNMHFLVHKESFSLEVSFTLCRFLGRYILC